MHSFLILSSYYWLILLSITGYGLLFSKLFIADEKKEIGYIGLYGVFFLIIISYITSFFLSHTLLFNSIVIFSGFIYLFFSSQKVFLKKNIKLLFLVYLILFIFILVGKNHDDFPYYHFPYIQLLTEYKGLIGIGNFNHGFRTHSSIFYLSSLFYLPIIDYFIVHISPVFFLGFTNIILYRKIRDNLKIRKNFYIIFLSLFLICFVNIFFYRLAEHGTDRSAMVLLMPLSIEILNFINQKAKIDKTQISRILILISLIISLKAFYIIYSIFLFLILFYVNNKKKLFLDLLRNKITYLCFVLVLCVISINFFNTGCLIYPAKFLCNENFVWSIPLDQVDKMNHWYHLWSKAGANPNFVVTNTEQYVQNFNWVPNWFEMYFFNKMSDFLLALMFVIIVFLIFFYRNKKRKTKRNYLSFYIMLLILLFEWFYIHPTLRYGGYSLLALIFFIPISILLENYSIDMKYLTKRINILILIIITVFLTRNIQRLDREYRINNYNFFSNVYYNKNQQNFKIFDGVNKINECINKRYIEECKNLGINVKKRFNTYIYYK